MTGEHKPVTDTELHAFADGLSEEQDRARIEAWLAETPEDAERVADWSRQNAEIRSLFAGHARHLPGDVDRITGFSRTTGPGNRLLKLLAGSIAAIAIFAAGAVTGRLVPLPFEPVQQLQAVAETLPREAQSAFLIYASEKRHPVEVGAGEEAHLAKWLGKRLDYPLAIPNLTSLGFQLVGGRLVPVNDKAGALLMYEDGNGQRLTILIGRNDDNHNTSFRYASVGTVETFYWIDDAIGYAVTGEISRDRLRQVAEECYKQLPT